MNKTELLEKIHEIRCDRKHFQKLIEYNEYYRWDFERSQRMIVLLNEQEERFQCYLNNLPKEEDIVLNEMSL